jgi:outer membrane protein assembly factor BamD (BamD/ComL family)
MSTRNFPAAVAELKRFKTRYPQSEMVPSINAMIPQLEKQIPRK